MFSKKQKTKKEEVKLSKTAELAKEIIAVKEQPLTRVVNLRYKSCCGCGCDWLDVKRTVPFDSKLKDGDIIKEIETDDIW